MALFVAMFVVATAIVTGVQVRAGTRTADAGDAFEKLDQVATYADQRLAAAASGNPLPAPPHLLADQRTLQIALGVTLITQAVVLAIAGIASGQTFTGLARTLGLNRYDISSVWRPGLAVIAAYVLVVLYAMAANATGVDWLKPTSTVPIEITRDNLTLSIAAVVTLAGAPFSEELFFRGVVFSGLLKWGFWPAAVGSAFLFTVFHLDPGSFFPFVLIGIGLAWLYWSRGTIWDSIIFHFFFNSASFVFLAWEP